MQNLMSPLSPYEEIILNLRGLFGRYGYTHCQVGPFEDYNFFLKNRSALPGEEVLVFTDADGSLTALKPDVTMSLVKNVKDGQQGLKKLCYNENIYRIPTGGGSFRESVQTGLECIGQLDDYAVGEVLMLALKSLSAIRKNYILNLSHVALMDGLLDLALPESADRLPILKAVGQKNLGALAQACEEAEIGEEDRRALETLTTLYGPIRDTLPQVEALSRGEKMTNACRELAVIRDLMEVYGLGDHLYLDFSVRGGTDYYSGPVFLGYVDNAAGPVLSGGRYDQLVHRMGKKAGGIGFAVYLDQLERAAGKNLDTDILLLYGAEVPAASVIRTVANLKQDGLRVRAEQQIPEDCRYGRLLKLTEEGVSELA